MHLASLQHPQFGRRNPYKHYRVRKKYTASGQVEYEIFLGDKKHPKLLSMTEVIDYFVKESENNFVPLKKANVHPHHEYDHIVKEEWNTGILRTFALK